MFWYNSYSWKSRSVKPNKPKTKTKTWNVCVVNLSISYYSNLYKWILTNSKLWYRCLLVECRLQADSIQNSVIHRARLQRVLCKILMLGLWNHHVKGFKSPLLKQSPTNILVNDLKLNITRLLVHITTWVNHHQN